MGGTRPDCSTLWREVGGDGPRERRPVGGGHRVDGRLAGRWEGDTLVVETTNFVDKTASFTPITRLAVGQARRCT